MLAGVGHLIAERFSENAELRGRLRRIFQRSGKIVCTKVEPPPTPAPGASGQRQEQRRRRRSRAEQDTERHGNQTDKRVDQPGGEAVAKLQSAVSPSQEPVLPTKCRRLHGDRAGSDAD